MLKVTNKNKWRYSGVFILTLNSLCVALNTLIHKSQNGQTHLKNLATFATRFLNCVWPFSETLCIKDLTYKFSDFISNFKYLNTCWVKGLTVNRD